MPPPCSTAMPARPPATVGIRVLGPLEVDHDGHPVDTPELHRTRVRELLSVLVVERTVTRDRVIDLLWPDLDPTRGRANLRVTLRHLQRVLEPARGQGSSPYFLRGDAQQLRLVSVPGLDVDSWQVDDLLVRSEAARRRGDSAGRIDHLRAAVRRWRGGRPLSDLERLADLSHVARHVEARLVDAAVTLGELELVGGAVDAAATLADRVLGADPYAERPTAWPSRPTCRAATGRRRQPLSTGSPACSPSWAPGPSRRRRSCCGTRRSGSGLSPVRRHRDDLAVGPGAGQPVRPRR